MRLRLLFLTLAVGVAVLGGSLYAAAATGGASRSAGSPITIGISLSLSGDFSDSGKAALRGYRLWADVVNAKGGLLGHPVKLKILDDTSSPTQVVTNYQNLITRNKVAFTCANASFACVPATTRSGFLAAYLDTIGVMSVDSAGYTVL